MFSWSFGPSLEGCQPAASSRGLILATPLRQAPQAVAEGVHEDIVVGYRLFQKLLSQENLVRVENGVHPELEGLNGVEGGKRIPNQKHDGMSACRPLRLQPEDYYEST